MSGVHYIFLYDDGGMCGLSPRCSVLDMVYVSIYVIYLYMFCKEKSIEDIAAIPLSLSLSHIQIHTKSFRELSLQKPFQKPSFYFIVSLR